MQFKLISIFLMASCSCSMVMAAEPTKPIVKETTHEPVREAAIAAAVAGAEFNRLRGAKPELNKVETVETALETLAASQEPINKALKKEDLVKYRKEVLALLTLQDGRLAGTPALNSWLGGVQTATVGVKARRNAQNLASVFNASRAAGSPEVEDVQNTDQAVARIRTGVKGGGQFSTSLFQVSLDEESLKTAKAFLSFDSEKGLVYESKVVLENEADPVPAPPAPDAVALVGMNLKMQAEMESKRTVR
jgi:hypothetical protein